MPCNCEYMNPTEAERNSQNTASCLMHYYQQAECEPSTPSWIIAAANDMYGAPLRLNEMTVLLCQKLRALSPEEADAAREAREAEKREKAKLRQSAKRKLTAEEWKAVRNG